MLRLFNLRIQYSDFLQKNDGDGPVPFESYDLLGIYFDDSLYLKYSDVRRYAGLQRIYNYGINFRSCVLKHLVGSYTAWLTKKDNNTRIIDVQSAVDFLTSHSPMKADVLKRALVDGEPLIQYKPTNIIRPILSVVKCKDDTLKSIFAVLQEEWTSVFKLGNCHNSVEPFRNLQRQNTIAGTPAVEEAEKRQENETQPFWPVSFQINFGNGHFIKYCKC